MRRNTITIQGRRMTLVTGGKKSDLERSGHYNEDNNWDFILEDIIEGAIEVNEEICYWYIDGRVYETDEESNRE